MCCAHSLKSNRRVTCHLTVKVACWSLTLATIGFYCLADSLNWNMSLLTTHTHKSSCGIPHDYVTVNLRQSSTLYMAVIVCRHGLTSSQYLIYIDWLTSGTVTSHYTNIHRVWIKVSPLFFCRAMLCISAAYAVMRCLSVCLCVSVTFVSCVETSNCVIISSDFFHRQVAPPF